MAGPDLTGIFTQSSFGIVTQMAFKLIHKPERRYLVWGSTADEALERLIDTVDHFGRQRVINRGSVNIGYENRFVQAQRSLREGAGPPSEPAVWNFYVLVTGTARATDVLAAELQDTFRTFCTVAHAVRVDRVGDPFAELRVRAPLGRRGPHRAYRPARRGGTRTIRRGYSSTVACASIPAASHGASPAKRGSSSSSSPVGRPRMALSGAILW